jgi:hypothetical protein
MLKAIYDNNAINGTIIVLTKIHHSVHSLPMLNTLHLRSSVTVICFEFFHVCTTMHMVHICRFCPLYIAEIRQNCMCHWKPALVTLTWASSWPWQWVSVELCKTYLTAWCFSALSCRIRTIMVTTIQGYCDWVSMHGVLRILSDR